MTDRHVDRTARWEELWSSQALMKRSYIDGDTYLNCWCPSCGAGLNEDRRAVFRTMNQRGEEELHHASPYINVLDQVCYLHLEDEELVNVSCPHCDFPLIEQDKLCRDNACRMAKIHISVQDSMKLSLSFCVGGSCRWYSMSDEDNERLILGESHEW